MKTNGHPEPVEGRLSLSKPRSMALVISASLLAACGGGGGSHALPPAGGGTTEHGTAKAEFQIEFPAKSENASRMPVLSEQSESKGSATLRQAQGDMRQAQHDNRFPASSSEQRSRMVVPQGYNSSSTKSIGFSVVAHGAGLPALAAPQVAANVGAGVSSANVVCSAANPDGSYSCEIEIAAPAGYDDFQITEWDGAATGNVPSGNVLAIDTISNQLTEQNQVNTLTFMPSGVAHYAAVDLTTTTMVSGTGNTTNVSVDAADADGNLITGNQPYVDSSNNPVTFTVIGTVSPAAASGDFTELSTTYTAPAQSNAVVYTPTSGMQISNVAFGVSAADAAIASSGMFGNELQLTSSGGSIGVGAVPQAQVIGTVANVSGNMIAFDGDLYVAESGEIAQFTTGGLKTEFPITGDAGWLAAGDDGDIWYVDSATNKIAKFNPAGIPAPAVIETAALPNVPNEVAAGPDGNMYVSANNAAYSISPQTMALSSITLPTASSSVNPQGVAAGPVEGGDQTVVFSDPGNKTIFYLDLKTGVATEVSGFNGTTGALVTASDAFVYVGTSGSGPFSPSIESFTPGGSSFYINTPGTPAQMIVGPEGNVWGAGQGFAAMIPIGASQQQGVIYGATSALPNDNFTGIAAGPDGNIWLADSTTDTIYKLVLP